MQRSIDGSLRSFIHVSAEGALKAAREADAAVRHREQTGLLHGVPIGLKDMIATQGLPTTGNSRVLQHCVPHEDATLVAKLKAAGAIVVGKLNMNEFAWSIPSESDLCPPPRNPWNHRYAALGSSSGSGAAVAAGLCYGSFGTDSGGSVRLPSACCGLFGLKPTHGRVSLHGVLGSKSITEVGPLARNAEDIAVLLQAVAGYDPKDPNSVDEPVPKLPTSGPRHSRAAPGCTMAYDRIGRWGPGDSGVLC